MTRVLILIFLAACEDQDVSKKNTSDDITDFISSAKEDQFTVDGTNLGDSWRVVRYKASYWDGDYKKEWDEDYLDLASTRPECKDYQEFWIFGLNEVMLAFKGSCFDKNFDGYYEKFNHNFDLPARTITVDYVYDDGEKTYSRRWALSSPSEDILILTEDIKEEDSFHEYTLRREKF